MKYILTWKELKKRKLITYNEYDINNVITNLGKLGYKNFNIRVKK